MYQLEFVNGRTGDVDWDWDCACAFISISSSRYSSSCKIDNSSRFVKGRQILQQQEFFVSRRWKIIMVRKHTGKEM